MKTTVLTDNNSHGELEGEWGFSALIESRGTKVLLDAGASDLFARNAQQLGIDLADIDYAVLSHAHFDHSDGFPAFFAANSHAPLLLRASCAENCYSDAKGSLEYIGIAQGLLADHTDRLSPISEDVEFAPGFHLVRHTTPGLAEVGKASHMMVKDGDELIADDFDHEQSLVVETNSGLAVFNSCSHSGVEAIVTEVRAAFPESHICALIGGLHLFASSDAEVLEVADTIERLGIKKVYTGHCTGDHAIELLQEKLGDRLETFYTGLAFEL